MEKELLMRIELLEELVLSLANAPGAAWALDITLAAISTTEDRDPDQRAHAAHLLETLRHLRSKI